MEDYKSYIVFKTHIDPNTVEEYIDVMFRAFLKYAFWLEDDMYSDDDYKITTEIMDMCVFIQKPPIQDK